MTRQTSIDVYNKIKSEGLLSAVDFAVYNAIFYSGPLTQGEAWNECLKHIYMRHTVGPAFARLKHRTCIEEIEIRPCRMTGRKVYSWDVTDNIPMKFEKPKKIKCENCKGKGFFIEQQSRLL